MSSTEQRLAEIQSRADAAWVEPWRARHVGDQGNKSWHVVDEHSMFICSLEDEAEAAFIAAARTDVPRLVAALRAVLELCGWSEEISRRVWEGKGDPKCPWPDNAQTSVNDILTAIAAALEPAPEQVTS